MGALAPSPAGVVYSVVLTNYQPVYSYEGRFVVVLLRLLIAVKLASSMGCKDQWPKVCESAVFFVCRRRRPQGYF